MDEVWWADSTVKKGDLLTCAKCHKIFPYDHEQPPFYRDAVICPDCNESVSRSLAELAQEIEKFNRMTSFPQ